jgi:hypothetical protein
MKSVHHIGTLCSTQLADERDIPYIYIGEATYIRGLSVQFDTQCSSKTSMVNGTIAMRFTDNLQTHVHNIILLRIRSSGMLHIYNYVQNTQEEINLFGILKNGIVHNKVVQFTIDLYCHTRTTWQWILHVDRVIVYSGVFSLCSPTCLLHMYTDSFPLLNMSLHDRLLSRNTTQYVQTLVTPAPERVHLNYIHHELVRAKLQMKNKMEADRIYRRALVTVCTMLLGVSSVSLAAILGTRPTA